MDGQSNMVFRHDIIMTGDCTNEGVNEIFSVPETSRQWIPLKQSHREEVRPETVASWPWQCCCLGPLPTHHSFVWPDLHDCACLSSDCSFTPWSRVHTSSDWLSNLNKVKSNIMMIRCGVRWIEEKLRVLGESNGERGKDGLMTHLQDSFKNTVCTCAHFGLLPATVGFMEWMFIHWLHFSVHRRILSDVPHCLRFVF